MKWKAIITLMGLIMTCNAVTIEGNISLNNYTGASRSGGWDANEIHLTGTTEASQIIIIPYNDCWGQTVGVPVFGMGFNGVNCTFNKTIGVGDVIYMAEVIDNTSGIYLMNQTGNLTYHNFLYNGTGNVSLYLDDLSNECNYGANGSYIKYVAVPVNATDYLVDCNISIIMNGSVLNTPTWVAVVEDESLSLLMLATALAGAGVYIIYKGYQWDSVS